MERTYLINLKENIGKKIKVMCWVYAKREHGGVTFLVLRDITGTGQAVILKESKALFEKAKDLKLESVVRVEGIVKEEKQAPNGVELKVEEIEELSIPEADLPIPVYVKGEETEMDTRLDWRWLDLRKPEKALIFKVWTTMEQAFREYCVSNGYIQIYSPKITITATESGSELFEVNYFDRKAFLAQSPQLYKQMAQAAGFEKVFEFGPVFRANPSFTSRHDTEFTMYDFEISFIESHEDIMKEEEKMIVKVFTNIKEKWDKEIRKYYKQEVVIPSLPFPRLTFNEVKKILKKMGVKSEREGDLSPEEERSICQYIKEKENHEFVFIYNWPVESRAFYSMRLESDNKLTKTFDLLFKGLEITSGAQREHRYEQLKKQIEEKGLDVKSFESYLSFFKYGCPPHGGMAPGPTRILMKILGLDNVREVTYLYRGVNRLRP